MQKDQVSRVFGAALLAGLGFSGLLSGCAVDAQTAEDAAAPEATTAVSSLDAVSGADFDQPIKAAPAIAREPIVIPAGESIVLTEDQIFEAPQERGAGDTEKACINRPVTSTALSWSGDFGHWATCTDFCPVGSHAYSVRLKTEGWQKNGDDTAVNGIALDCWKPVNGGTQLQYMGSVTSSVQTWGSWGTASTCPINKPIYYAQVKSERALGSGGDDVALTNFIAVCKDGQGLVQPTIPVNTNWGEWRTNLGKCSAGSGVCGIKTRVEWSQNSGDDTALNGVELSCCSL